LSFSFFLNVFSPKTRKIDQGCSNIHELMKFMIDIDVLLKINDLSFIFVPFIIMKCVPLLDVEAHQLLLRIIKKSKKKFISVDMDIQ